MMKIVYTIAGTLPAPWEDFLSPSESYPNITIASSEESAIAVVEDVASRNG
jgi:hypothetical protein